MVGIYLCTDPRIDSIIDVNFQILTVFYIFLGQDKIQFGCHALARSYKAFKNDFLFEKILTGYLAGIVEEFSKGKPTLVFCR